MEPQERGRGEGKEEGRGERRIMAELLTTPRIAKEDFLFQCAGVGTAGDTHQHAACGAPVSMGGTGRQLHHMCTRSHFVRRGISFFRDKQEEE